MRIELGGYEESALLDLAVSLTMNQVTHAGRLGVFGDAIEAVLEGIRSELMRRWRGEAGPPIAIQFPCFTPSARAEVAQGFMTFQELFRARFRSQDGLSAPFLAESLRLAQTIALAVAPTSELRN